MTNATSRPARLWPVLAWAALFGGTGAVRLVVGLLRTSQAPGPPPAFSVTSTLTFVGIKSLVLLAVAVVAGLASRDVVRRLRLGPSTATPTVVALASVTAYALGTAGYALASAVGLDQLSLVQSSNQQLAAVSFPAFVALTLAFTLGGAAEELFYRGFVQARLAERWGRWPAILVAASAFGLAHGDLLHAVLMLAMGVLLGWLAETFQSIRPAVVAHVVNNLLSCGLERWGPGPSTAVQVAQSLVLVVAMAALLASRRRAQPA